jgi:hypothetical protein
MEEAEEVEVLNSSEVSSGAENNVKKRVTIESQKRLPNFNSS